MRTLAGETWGAAGRGNIKCHKSCLQWQGGAGIPCRGLAKMCTLLSWHCIGLSGQDPWWLLATVWSSWQSLSKLENNGMTVLWYCSVAW